MKSKFIFEQAVPLCDWEGVSGALAINSKENVDLNIQGQRFPAHGMGLHLFRLKERKKMGAIIGGNFPYQLCLIGDTYYRFPPLGFWFRNSNKDSYTLMIPTYDSHYKLNLARFY